MELLDIKGVKRRKLNPPSLRELLLFPTITPVTGGGGAGGGITVTGGGANDTKTKRGGA